MLLEDPEGKQQILQKTLSPQPCRLAALLNLGLHVRLAAVLKAMTLSTCNAVSDGIYACPSVCLPFLPVYLSICLSSWLAGWLGCLLYQSVDVRIVSKSCCVQLQVSETAGLGSGLFTGWPPLQHPVRLTLKKKRSSPDSFRTSAQQAGWYAPELRICLCPAELRCSFLQLLQSFIQGTETAYVTNLVFCCGSGCSTLILRKPQLLGTPRSDVTFSWHFMICQLQVTPSLSCAEQAWCMRRCCQQLQGFCS